jgi:uncharacterized protein (DUF2062 family)
MKNWLQSRKNQIAAWLGTGISPDRLALTLALGFAIGCLPLVGVTTAVCLLVAIVLRLNVPAIQAANYVAMPLQLALVLPFMKLGSRLFASAQQPTFSKALFQGSLLFALKTSGKVAGQAIGAWVVIAIPAVALMTITFAAILRRVPVLAAECGD